MDPKPAAKTHVSIKDLELTHALEPRRTPFVKAKLSFYRIVFRLIALVWLGHAANFGLFNSRSAHAQVTPFYEGKTVRVIVGPSGGYDYWARLLAKYMPKYIAGSRPCPAPAP